MLKGSREAVVRRIQPMSIHGQIWLDVHFVPADEPEGPASVARVGSEAVSPGIEIGDRVRLDYVLGAVTAVTKIGGDGTLG